MAESYVYKDDYLEMDPWRHEVRVDGTVIHLTPIQWKIMAAFVGNAGRALSFQDLWVAAWGEAGHPEHALLKWHIKKLRQKLGHEVPIVSSRGYGYRYDAHGLSGG